MESERNKPTTNSSGPNFSMTLEDNDSTFSFINKVASQVYPEGKVIIKNTTASQRGFEEKTLVSHNVEGIMAGNALSRNPAMASVAYDRLTTSTLESHLAFGSDFSVADKKEDQPQPFSFPDSSYSGLKGDSTALHGPAAFKAAVSSSVLGTGFAPGLFQQKAYAYSAGLSSSATSDDGTAADGGNYQVDADALGIGPAKNGYPAALISDLTDAEKDVYIQAIQIVNSNVSANLSTKGFSISATDKKLTETSGQINDQGKEAAAGTAYDRTLPGAFVDLPDPSSFYPSITLLKMLIEMTDPNGLDLDVGFGLDRGADLSSSKASMTENAKKTISDHAFGRAVDIFAVGQKNSAGSKLKVKLDNYKKCFEAVMEKIATLPTWMQPDEVVISREAYAMYVSEDIQKKQAFINRFPGLSKYLSVGQDAEGSSNHTEHIHLGFHWTRAGSAAVFLGSGSGTESLSTNPVAMNVFQAGSAEAEKYVKMGKNTYLSDSDQISPVDLGKIMATTGIFNIEEIAVFCGIAERESNIRPHAIQAGNLLALGMFQNELYNFIDGKIGSYSVMDFYLPEGTSTRYADQGNKTTLKGWQFYFNKESGVSQKDLKPRDKMVWNREKIDPIFFIPLNQIAIIAQMTRVYKPTASASSAKFSQYYKDNALDRGANLSRVLWTGWGDGAWGDQSANQSWGALTNVKVQTVKSVYEALGGKWYDFIRWAVGYQKTPGALCDAITVSQIEKSLKDGEDRKIYGPPYRSIWDVFIWAYDLFDEAINYFSKTEEKNQFTSDRWPDTKVFAPGKRQTIFTRKIVEDIIKMDYTQYIAYNAPRGG